MRSNSRLSLLVKILLPLFLALALLPSPVPRLVTNGLSGAARAEKRGDDHAKAALLHGVLLMMPWRADLWEQAGMSAYAAQQYETALHDFEQARKVGKLTPKGMLTLGLAHRDAGNLGEAIRVWSDAAAQDSAPDEVYDLLISEFTKKDDGTQAVGFLESWTGRHPDDARAIYRLGLYLSLDDPEAASQLLQRLLVLDPTLAVNARVVQGALTAASSEENAAYRALLTGRALGSIEEWRLAKTAFEKAAALELGYAEAWAFLGEARQQVGESVGDAFERAHSLNPSSTLVQALEALFWRRRGELETALIHLKAVAEQEPENGWWQIEIGSTLAEMGDLPSALAYYENAVKLDPSSAIYWRMLGLFCIEYNVEAESTGLDAARQAVLLAPNDPAALDVMGQAMMKMQDLGSAERFFLRALEKAPGYDAAKLHLALVYIDQGREGEAYPLLKQVTEAEPGTEIGQQAQRFLELFTP